MDSPPIKVQLVKQHRDAVKNTLPQSEFLYTAFIYSVLCGSTAFQST